MLHRVAVSAVLALVTLGNSAVLCAQESRVTSIEQLRAEKAAQLHPYQPGTIEKALLYIEREDPLRRISPHNGFFVEYGYTAKPIGSGLGAGVGYRHDLFDRRARVVVEAGASLRRYHMVRGDFSLPSLAGGRLEVGVEANNRHHPQEDFFGLGPASLRSDRVSFLFDRRELQGRAVVKPGGGLRTGVRIGRLDTEVGPGRDARYPSIELRFSDIDAPGLARQPAFSYTDLFAILDRRDQPGNPRAGGFYGVFWRQYSDLDFDQYSFHQLDADLQHFFPIFDKKRVIAVRGRVAAATAGDGQIVPFFLRPTAGGHDSLRSTDDFRFRDNSMAALNVEYRWEAFSGLDMALFSDFAQVAPRFADLDLKDFEQGYGLGFRFNTYKSVFLRLDLAVFGADAPRLFIKFNKAF